MENVDVVHCLLLFLHDRVKRSEKAAEEKTQRNEMFWQNFFALLEMIKMAESKTSAVDEWLIPLSNSSQQQQQQQQSDEDSAAEAVTKTGTSAVQDELIPIGYTQLNTIQLNSNVVC